MYIEWNLLKRNNKKSKTVSFAERLIFKEVIEILILDTLSPAGKRVRNIKI